MKKTTFLSILAAIAFAALPVEASPVYGLTTIGTLIRWDSTAPGIITSIGPTGLGANGLIGIDFRPATGELYGVSSGNGIFIIDQNTGAATQVSTLNQGLVGSSFGVDFNPVPDRLRLVSDQDQNLRVNVATGVAMVDGALAFAAGDPNFGVNPFVVAAGYTNSVAGAATTTLYVLDSNLNALLIQNPPNNGVLNTVGAVGLDFTPVVGFDIDPRMNTAFAAFNTAQGGPSLFYQINLGTGAGTLIGAIGGGNQIAGIAVAPVPEPATLSLIGLGLAGFVVWRRKSQSV